MRIFVIGYMGVGKSKQSLLLAESMKVPFLDIDSEIEAQEGKSITKIFEEEGEKYFRETERNVLVDLSKWYSEGVFATGGGLPCQAGALELLGSLGVTVYLQATAEQIVQRLVSNRSARPLVAAKSDDELYDYVSASLAIRGPIYEQADLCIKLDLEESIEHNAEIIQREMRRLQETSQAAAP